MADLGGGMRQAAALEPLVFAFGLAADSARWAALRASVRLHKNGQNFFLHGIGQMRAFAGPLWDIPDIVRALAAAVVPLWRALTSSPIAKLEAR